MQRISSINSRQKIDSGWEVKNSVGNVEAEELICMIHGHELKAGNVGRRGCAGRRGIKMGKWDNCNSTINKIYLS